MGRMFSHIVCAFACVLTFADVCCLYNDVRKVTVYKMQLSGCHTVRAAIINVEVKPTASVRVFPDFILGCIGNPV